MRVEIKRSGGILGAEIGGVLESEELGDDLRMRLLQVLEPDRLTRAGQMSPPPGAADFFSYDVTTPDGDWIVSGSGSDRELIGALDEAVAEIVRRRREDSAGPMG